MGHVEPLMGQAGEVGGEPGAAPQLEAAHLLVGEDPVGPHLGPQPAELAQTAQVPSPRRRHRPGPDPVAHGQGHHHLPGGEQQRLRQDPDEVERAVALQDGPELVPALQRLQGGGLGLPGQQGHLPQPAGHGLQVAHPGVGRHHHPGPGHLGPPAQVEILGHGHHGGVEPAQLGEEVGPHQGDPAGGHEDVAHRVVLAVIDLPHLHPLDHRTGLVGVHPDVQQDRRVLPADHLGRDHTGVGAVGLLDQDVDGVRIRRTVVVAEEEEGRSLDHPHGLVDRRPEPPIVVEAPHEGLGQDPPHPGRRVLLPPDTSTRTSNSS